MIGLVDPGDRARLPGPGSRGGLVPAAIVCILLAAPLAGQSHRVVRVTPPGLTAPAEVSVAIDPTDPDHVVAVALAAAPPPGPRITDFAFASGDGGASWTMVALPNPDGRVQGDDVVAFGPDGVAYHAYIAFEGIRVERPERAVNGIFVSASADGGTRWAPPVPVIDHLNTVQPFEDKPWLAADGTASPHRGNVYVAWTRFDVYGSSAPHDSTQIWFARSRDGGRTFEPPFRISDTGGDAVDSDDTVEGAVPAVGPDGTVYVAWAGPKGLVLDRSTDGGRTFGPDRVIGDNPGGWDIPLAGATRHNGMPVTATDVSDGPFRGSVYVNWIDERNGDPDVFVMRSADGGDTWSDAVRVNDDEGDAAQLFTWLAVDPVDGSLNVVFLDRRGLDGTRTRVMIARSVDGGRSFVNHPVDQAPFAMRDGVFFGDYIGVAAHGGRVIAVWPHVLDGGGQALSAAIFEFELHGQRTKR